MECDLTGRGGCAVFFDSGVGGLNLLHACALRAPALNYYYLSDGANVPYGNRSDGEILRLTLAALKGVEELRPRALVVACNTVTARCIDELRARYDFPVIGIQPAVKQAAKVGGRCLVMVTEATATSRKFKELAALHLGKSAEIFASRELAEYVERHVLSLPEELPEGLLPDVEADSVVPGCTHYAFIEKQIKSRYKCPIFDGIEGTAAQFLKSVGIFDHWAPPIGIFDHHGVFKPKITFLGQNGGVNRLVYDRVFSNK